MSELRTQIVRGSLAGGLARVMTIAVGLFMTPYLLTRLGAAQFGLWSLATAVGASYGLLDLGFRSGIVKYMAESFAHRNRSQAEQIAATCLFLYLGLAVAALAVYSLVAQTIFDLLSVPEAMRGLAFPVFTIVLLTAALSSSLSVFPSVLDAQQRMGVTQALGVACLLCGAMLTVYLVESGYGLTGVAIAQFSSSLLFYLASAWLVRDVVSYRVLSPGSFSLAIAKRLFRYGSRLYVSSVCEIVNRQFDKVLFARLGGLPLVASYEIAGRMVGNVGSLQGNLLAPLLPATSRLAALSESDRLRRLYVEASRYSFLVAIPPFFLLALLSRDVVLLWLGHSDPVAAHVLQLLATGFLFNNLSHAMAATCQGIGAPEIQAEQSLVQMVSNIVLSLVLLVPLGISGPPIGTSLALVLGAIYFARRFHPRIGVDNREFLRQTLLPPLVAATGAALVSYAAMRLGWNALPQGRVDALIRVSVVSAIFGVVYLGSCSARGYVRLGELSALRRLVFSSAREKR